MGERQQGLDWAMEGGKAARVLLVEGGENSGVVASLLRECRYDVAACTSGDATIELVDARPQDYDVVLADAADSGCLKLLQRCRANRLFPPVVVMSDQEGSAVVLEYLRLGAADYLLKPVRKNELNNLWQHAWRRFALSQGHADPASDPPPRTSTTAQGDEASRDTAAMTARGALTENGGEMMGADEASPGPHPGDRDTRAGYEGSDNHHHNNRDNHNNSSDNNEGGDHHQSSGGSGPGGAPGMSSDADIVVDHAEADTAAGECGAQQGRKAGTLGGKPMDAGRAAAAAETLPIRPRAGRTSLGAAPSLDVLDAVGASEEGGVKGGTRIDVRKQGRRDSGGLEAEEGGRRAGDTERTKSARGMFDGRKHGAAEDAQTVRKQARTSKADGTSGSKGAWRSPAHHQSQDSADETTSLHQGEEDEEDKQEQERRMGARSSKRLGASSGGGLPSSAPRNAGIVNTWTFPYACSSGEGWRATGAATSPNASGVHPGQGAPASLGHSETRSAFSRYGPAGCSIIGGGRQVRPIAVVPSQGVSGAVGPWGAVSPHLTKWSDQGKEGPVATGFGGGEACGDKGFRSIFSSPVADANACSGAGDGIGHGACSAFRSGSARRTSVEHGAAGGSMRTECADSNDSHEGPGRAAQGRAARSSGLGAAAGASRAGVAECAHGPSGAAVREDEDRGSGSGHSSAGNRDGSPGVVDKEAVEEMAAVPDGGYKARAAAAAAAASSPRIESGGSSHRRASDDGAASSRGRAQAASHNAGGDNKGPTGSAPQQDSVRSFSGGHWDGRHQVAIRAARPSDASDPRAAAGFDYRRSPLSSPVGWPPLSPPPGASHGGHMYGVYGHPGGSMVQAHPGGYMAGGPGMGPYQPQPAVAPQNGAGGPDACAMGKDGSMIRTPLHPVMGEASPMMSPSGGGGRAGGFQAAVGYPQDHPGRDGPSVSVSSSGITRSALAGSSSSDGETDISLARVRQQPQPNGFLKWAGATRIGAVHALEGDLHKPGRVPGGFGKPGAVRPDHSEGSMYGHGHEIGRTASGSHHYAGVSHSHVVTDSDNTGTATGLGSTSCDDISDSTAAATASALMSSQILDTAGSLIAQRKAALSKFLLKRKERCFDKKVRYQSRKRLAEQRPRVRGQFVRKDAEIHD
eukprot:jgi/Mesvir1/6114/Mv00821-RA.3